MPITNILVEMEPGFFEVIGDVYYEDADALDEVVHRFEHLVETGQEDWCEFIDWYSLYTGFNANNNYHNDYRIRLSSPSTGEY